MVFSHRGLTFLGLMLALFLTVGTAWIRPPVRRDLGSFELSLVGCASQSARQTESPFRLNSPGALMVLVIGAGLAATAHPSRHAALAGGLVISGGLAANAAAVLNQPGLIESLQLEHRQRQEMAIVLAAASAGNAVSTLSNGRVAGPPDEIIECGSSLEGWSYLLHGKWVVMVGSLIFLFTSLGRLSSRLLGAAAWILIGAVLSCAVCSERLLAEYCWSRSEELVAAADYPRAREAFTQTLRICPALEGLQRTWYWTGKLDYLEGKQTSQETFFRATQLANGQAYEQAGILMDELLASDGKALPVREQSAQILAALGLVHYLGGAIYDPSRATDARDRLMSTESAVAYWSRALIVHPERADCLLFRSVALAELTDATARVERDAQRFLMLTADRSLQADMLVTLGDVYFQAGQIQRARQYYEQSKRIFELPKDINFRARRGLLGV